LLRARRNKTLTTKAEQMSILVYDEEGLIEAGIAAVKDWDKPVDRDTIVDIVEAVVAEIRKQ